MMHVSDIERWLSEAGAFHFLLGYGSLLNADSRLTHSAIPHQGIPVTVKGFERGWVTRSIQEKQTYVGAKPKANATLNAQLIPVELNPSLQQRERDYQFVEVPLDQLVFALPTASEQALRQGLQSRRIWLCETLALVPADENHPVSQTYIDTCLAGCLEQGGEEAAKAFITSTTGWSHPRVNDRAAPNYPRAGRVSDEHLRIIDALMDAYL